MQALILAFVLAAKEPCAVEPGQEPLPLVEGSYEVALSGGRVTIQAWSANTNLVRRVTGVLSQAAGRLELEIERFGKRMGTLVLVDKAHRTAEKTTRRAGRLVFREWMRRALARHFAGWQLRELTAEADLEHSLSPAYSRAFLKKGAEGWAAIGAPPECLDADGALAFGLIWLDYLRKREPRVVVEGLAIFLPEGRERTTCLRVRCLDSDAASYAIFVYAPDGWEQKIDVADAGNLDSCLPVRDTQFPVPAWAERLADLHGVERIDLAGDHVSWRVRGLEFARWDGKDVRFGIDGRHRADQSHAAEIARLVIEVARARCEGSAGTLYSRAPERWLECQLRQDLANLDAGLLRVPVYGQVTSISGVERGVIDLLACSFDGRLAVVEVKASEDLQLPLQALDYWMRVRRHAELAEFGPKGYFPDLSLRPEAPRLYLVAPALCFHPSTETLLRFYSSDIEVERIGVSMNWRSELKVVHRMRG
jgi:hypothetical protein